MIFCNYRSISILSPLSEYIEEIIKDRIINFLNLRQYDNRKFQ